ncbi:MAG: YCF48-related protein [Candidatus Kapaibacterium sp.]
MKRIFTLFFVVLLMVFAMNLDAQVNQDWKWAHPGPQGNQMRWIKIIDSLNWYACGNTGTFMKTSNAGANWTVYTNAGGWLPAYFGEGRNLMNGWFFDLNTGVICGFTGWIARTTNAGVSWDSIGIPTTNSMYGLHFVNNTVGYASGAGGRLLKTTNAGLSWDSIPSGISTANYNVYALDTNRIFFCTTLSNPLTSKVVKSSNGGINWTTYTMDTAFTAYDINFINENTGMVCGSAGVVRFTSNGGETWIRANIPSTVALYGIHSSLTPTPTFYVVGAPTGIYKTEDYGANWTLLSFNDPNMTLSSTHYSVDVSGNMILAIGAYGSIQKSTNAGANFTTLTHWLSSATKYAVWSQYNNGLVLAIGGRTFPNFDQVLRSTNGGTNWAVIPFNSTATYNSLSMVNSSTGYMSGSLGNLRKTTNAGLNWDSIPGPFGTFNLKRIEFVNAATGYVFQQTTNTGGGWKTTNGGLSWDSLTNMGSETRIASSSFINANTGYAGNNLAKLMKTTDGGANWTILANTPMGTFGLYGIKFFNADSGYVCGAAGLKLCKTTNGGTSFDTIITPFNNTLYSMNWINFNSGWVFGSVGYAGKTTDGGANWFIHNTSGQIGYGCHLTHLDSGFVVGDNAYILKVGDNQTVTGTQWSGVQIPSGYYLKQNYPNPFNPVTTIEFSLPKQGFVTLKIYDITGREISNAINMTLSPGVVKYKFNGMNLSSGVYFYRLVVDAKAIDTKKMILVK